MERSAASNCLPTTLGGRTPLLPTEGKPDPHPFFENAFHTFADGWLVELPQGELGVSVDGQLHPIRTGLRREIALLSDDN